MVGGGIFFSIPLMSFYIVEIGIIRRRLRKSIVLFTVWVSKLYLLLADIASTLIDDGKGLFLCGNELDFL